MTKWNSILSECSIKLMKLIIQHEESVLTVLNTEMVTIQDQVKSFENTPEYAMLQEKMTTSLQKLEDYITNTKKVKFKRDILDYQKNQVYSWKPSAMRRRTLRPILKNKVLRPPQYYRCTPRSVSFSEGNIPNDMSNMSVMEYLSNSSM